MASLYRRSRERDATAPSVPVRNSTKLRGEYGGITVIRNGFATPLTSRSGGYFHLNKQAIFLAKVFANKLFDTGVTRDYELPLASLIWGKNDESCECFSAFLDSIMYVSVNQRLPVSREDESDFVVQLLVDLMAGDEFVDDNSSDELPPEYVVGRVWAERLDWAYAEEIGYSPIVICDQASATWMQVYETICRRDGQDFRRDLGLDNYVSSIIFIHEILLHPEIDDRVAVVDAIIRGMSDDNSVLLMHHEQSETYHLDDWECRDLGFQKIARSNLLIKDNHYRYPFGDKFTAGRNVSLAATAEHESWVLERWEDLIADHPSL